MMVHLGAFLRPRQHKLQMVNVSCRVAASAMTQHRFCIENRLDAAAYTARSLGFLRPDRLKDPHDHRRIDVAHTNVADHRIRVRFERVFPLLDMLAISPLGFVRADKRFSGFTKCHVGIRRYVEQLSALLLTSGKDGIDKVPDHVTVSSGQFPRLAQRNPRERTEAHLPHPAVQFEPEHPRACTAVSNLHIETAAVRVMTWRHFLRDPQRAESM